MYFRNERFLVIFIPSQFYRKVNFIISNNKTREILNSFIWGQEKTQSEWTNFGKINWNLLNRQRLKEKAIERGLLVWEVKGIKDVTNQYQSEFELVIRRNTAMTLYICIKGITGHLDKNLPLYRVSSGVSSIQA